jgi:hypothetical protein
MSIHEELKVISFAHFCQIQQELAPIPINSLDAGYWDGSHILWYNSIHFCKGSKSRFCSPGLHHSAVVVLFEFQMCVLADPQPS